ncbi:MAG: esterase-like activity of phytase family protein [Gammaproteobacteria bacterium]|nr:esterase-like activity of phytase family protein [Gammaproteobacteria bacterium]
MIRTLLLLTALLPAAPIYAQDGVRALETRPVLLTEQPGGAETAGRLRGLGMLELPDITVDGLRLSQLSGLAWDDDDEILYAISDKGALFHLRPVLRDGKLAKLQLLKAVPLREAEGKPLKGRRADSEGLDILKGRNGRKGDAELVISFERFPRIVRYRPDGTVISEYPLPAPLNDRNSYRDSNKMLESVCVDEKLSVLTLPEDPLLNERPGYNRIFNVTGGSWLIPTMGEFRPSAIECLGSGRVLILERDFGRLLGRAVALRIATLVGDSGESVAAVETVALLDTAQGYQIDNFEGLTRHKGNRFFMVSDNNDLFVQRTLLLYFELVER